MAHDGMRPSAQSPSRAALRSRAAARSTKRATKTGEARQKEASAAQTQTEDSLTKATQIRRVDGRGDRTLQVVALVVVVVLLTASYARSAQIYFRQRQDIILTHQQITASDERINQLENEIASWQDPAYVRTQARERLGWVVPGETGYKVLGTDGKPLGGGAEISTDGGFPKGEHAQTWWERMWESVQAADNPVPISKR